MSRYMYSIGYLFMSCSDYLVVIIIIAITSIDYRAVYRRFPSDYIHKNKPFE